MAGCELFMNALFYRHARNYPGQKYPYKMQKFTGVPLGTQKPLSSVVAFHRGLCLSTSSSSSSSSSSTMEAPPPPPPPPPPQGYRKNVGICLINSSRKIFAASKLYIPGSWQMPQGGTDEGENPRNAAIRELREETGVISAEILAEVPYWLTYDFPPNVKAKINRRWGSDWKGQAQKWFLFKFTGKEEEINLLGDGTEKPEFGKWRWMSPEQVFEHAVDFKKPVYKQVLEVFGPYLMFDKDERISSDRNGNQ